MAHEPSSVQAELAEIRCWADMCAAAPRDFAEAVGLELASVGGATAVIAPAIPSVEFNRAVGLGAGRMASETDVEDLLAFFRARKQPKGLVQVMSGAQPDQIEDWLLKHGAQRIEREWVVLERGVEEFTATATDLRIGVVDQSLAAASAEAFCRGYGLPASFQPFLTRLVGRPGWTAFGAFDGTRIVATAYLWIDGRRALLAGAATDPAARRRGAQGALLSARIAAAGEAGVEVVQSHTGAPRPGEPAPSLANMQRAGLKIVHRRRNYLVGEG